MNATIESLQAQPVWGQALTLAGAVLIFAGASFTLIASIGLVRFPDTFSRIHASAKPQMLGLMLSCGGLSLMLRTWQWVALCTLVIALQMIAAPVASHLLGRAAYREGLAHEGALAIDELGASARTQEAPDAGPEPD